MTTDSMAYLAKSGIDWLQLIVFLLVIGGSVLGTISKKLIEYFGGGKAKKKDHPTTIHHNPRPAVKPLPVQPKRPVARPFPVTPTQRPLSRPVAQPLKPAARSMQPRNAPPVASAEEVELPELLAEVIGFPKPTTQQPQPKKIRPPASPKKPATPSKSRRANLAPRGELRTSKRRPIDAELSHSKIPLKSKGKKSSLHKKHHRDRDITEGQLVHLDDIVDLSDSMHASQGAYESRAMGYAMTLTPMSLRKAIILNEILQPPISLRADSF